MPSKVVIMGAAGRDSHNFNTVFRGDSSVKVVAFTAAQIPGIAGRRYPAALAGPGYPRGIPIEHEDALPALIARHKVDTVYFSYSDVPHLDVMHKASLVLSCGASFGLLGPDKTMLRATRPVISVGAVRTGAGKSPFTRRLLWFFAQRGVKAVAVRHPMPYGDLLKQRWQRFASEADMDAANCTVEEREEYEPIIRMGGVVYAGVDYHAILRRAQAEADVILWDGGNNDFPFFKPDLHLVLLDPHRAGHELSYHPGEANLRMADVLVVSKVNTAKRSDVRTVTANARAANPGAPIVMLDLVLSVDRPLLAAGKRVLVVEDGPTVTHGGMAYGAGYLAAQRLKAEVVDGRRSAVGSVRQAYDAYPQLHYVVPALGYSPAQLQDLHETIARARCDTVLAATPSRLKHLIKVEKPIVHVGYEVKERGRELAKILDQFIQTRVRGAA
jgi:predicted GTPase